MASEPSRSLGDRIKEKTLRTGIRMILDVMPVRTMMANTLGRISGMMADMAHRLHSHPLEADELESMYLVEFRQMPDGHISTRSHRVAVLDRENTPGELTVRKKAVTSLDRYARDLMALDVPESEMVDSLVDTFTSGGKLPTAPMKALPPKTPTDD